ncbi:MAG: hypothetical protein BMS9Abin37_0655 [Acidobacteriota bacterium]|nr:MAG: hypothetical protein BMS9Abin37_0655 [Acidobacteriota bacterium]
MVDLKNPESLAQDLQRAVDEIRSAHQLRPLTEDESGDGVDNLPKGVYGFTYSPALENFPLFKDRDLRCYEGHKLADGSVVLLGFLTAEEKQKLDNTSEKATIHLFAEPTDNVDELVRLPTSRVLSHVEYSQRGGKGLELSISAVD